MDSVVRIGARFAHPLVISALIPCIALADQVSRTLDGSAWSFWISMLFVQIVSSLGWAASSWAQLAGWQDGPAETRYRIGQGMFIAALSGNVAYYGVYYVLPTYDVKTTEVGAFIAAAMAAFMGEKFLAPLARKFLGFFNLTESP